MKLSCFIENDNTKNLLIYKSPVKDILNNSTLVVSESEEAIFVRDGAVINSFSYGRYKLTTNKYPLLFSVQKKLLDDVSSVSVYFIRMSDNVNLEWGTDSPIQMVDYKYGFTVNVGAFGTYSFKIKDPHKTLVKLIGLDVQGVSVSAFSTKFKAVFTSFIKTEIAVYMKERQLSVMDMNTEYFNISKALETKLQEQCEEYGVALINFFVNSISIPKNDPNYARINEAIVQKNIYTMQGSAYEAIAKRESGMEYAKNSNMQTVVGIPPVVAQAPQPSTNKSGQEGVCFKCGKTINAEMAFCPYCGEKQQKAQYCGHCGAKIEPGMKFCFNCGKEV